MKKRKQPRANRAAFCHARQRLRRGARDRPSAEPRPRRADAQNGWIFPCQLCPRNKVCYFRVVEVVLRKVGRKPGRAVVGRLLRPPRKGSVVVIEFADGLHEYVTTPVKRVLQLCGQETYYLQTANSRYRLEVRSSESGIVNQPVAN